MFEIYEKVLLSDNQYRLISRKGDNKKKWDVEDILSLYNTLGKSHCFLPNFVVEDPDRLPRLKPGEEDVFNLSTTITDIKVSASDFYKMTSELCSKSSHVRLCDPVMSSMKRKS